MSLTIDAFKAILIKNKEAKIRITSDSMRPLIFPGDILKVQPMRENLKRFDIIIFDYYGQPFCHFFWEEIKNGENLVNRCFTRSLKNPSQMDIPISLQDIIGIVPDIKINIFLKLKIYLSILCRLNGN